MKEQPKTMVPNIESQPKIETPVAPTAPISTNPTPAPVVIKKCSFFTYFFAFIGVLTILFWIGLAGMIGFFWFADPFGVRGFVKDVKSDTSENSFDASEVELSGVTVGEIMDFDVPEEQQTLLKAVGIDIEEVKQQDSAVLEACVSERLGQESLEGFKSGEETPSLTEILRIKSCL